MAIEYGGDKMELLKNQTFLLILLLILGVLILCITYYKDHLSSKEQDKKHVDLTTTQNKLIIAQDVIVNSQADLINTQKRLIATQDIISNKQDQANLKLDEIVYIIKLHLERGEITNEAARSLITDVTRIFKIENMTSQSTIDNVQLSLNSEIVKVFINKSENAFNGMVQISVQTIQHSDNPSRFIVNTTIKAHGKKAKTFKAVSAGTILSYSKYKILVKSISNDFAEFDVSVDSSVP